MNSGERLKNLREKNKLTLRNLSQITGISKATLSRYENLGLENVSMDKIQVLADKLEVTPDYLLGNHIKDNYINYVYKSTINKIDIDKFTDKVIADSISKFNEELQMKSKKIDEISNQLNFLNIQGLEVVKILVYALKDNDSFADKFINETYKKMINIVYNSKKDPDES